MPKTTLQLAKKIEADIHYTLEDYRKYERKQIHPEMDMIRADREEFKTILNALREADGLTKFAYEEQRVDEILKKVIEKNRAILIELIKQENALVQEEEQALAAVQQLKNYREDILNMVRRKGQMDTRTLDWLLGELGFIIELLERDAQIEQALSLITSDLASLVASLNSAKQIKA